jgi:hypothetical protein
MVFIIVYVIANMQLKTHKSYVYVNFYYQDKLVEGKMIADVKTVLTKVFF